MERAANDIIRMLQTGYIFKPGIPIENKIYSDVPKFLNLLIKLFEKEYLYSAVSDFNTSFLFFKIESKFLYVGLL